MILDSSAPPENIYRAMWSRAIKLKIDIPATDFPSQKGGRERPLMVFGRGYIWFLTHSAGKLWQEKGRVTPPVEGLYGTSSVGAIKKHSKICAGKQKVQEMGRKERVKKTMKNLSGLSVWVWLWETRLSHKISTLRVCRGKRARVNKRNCPRTKQKDPSYGSHSLVYLACGGEEVCASTRRM